MKTGVWLAMLSSFAAGAVLAQSEGTDVAREEQLREQIAALQSETGLARPAELVDPLRALALLYEEAGDHALAIVPLEEARHVARVHNGLTSADEALLLRQQVRNEKALGLHGRAWNLEQDMVAIARHHLDDPRMLPIFRELAEDRLAAIDRVDAGERPPLIYAGCYNSVPLPPYDYTSNDARRVANSSGFTSQSCFGGINQWLTAKLRSEILMYYADAIEIILRTGDYASEELRQLERAAIRVADNRTFGTMRPASGSGGRVAYCSAGTLDHYLTLDILSSCLAPVRRGDNFVYANVGGGVSFLRLLAYEVQIGAPAATRANALAELADLHVMAVPLARRRFIEADLVHALYQRAYADLQQSGDVEAATQLFAPDLPITLPTYEPNPFVSVATESRRYLDVSFAVTRFGTAERVEFLDTSRGATRTEQRELVRLIASSSFRPRFVDGEIADSAPVVARYALP
jgi:tetratricopeptide (TPR) repeat protein